MKEYTLSNKTTFNSIRYHFNALHHAWHNAIRTWDKLDKPTEPDAQYIALIAIMQSMIHADDNVYFYNQTLEHLLSFVINDQAFPNEMEIPVDAFEQTSENPRMFYCSYGQIILEEDFIPPTQNEHIYIVKNPETEQWILRVSE